MAGVGIVPQVVADPHTIKGLVEALLTWYGHLPDNEGQP
jgi:hypothetical protein